MDLAIVAVFCSVLFEPVELELLASLANTTAFAAVTAERLQWVPGGDSAEMRERAVQQNGSQRMSEWSNQFLGTTGDAHTQLCGRLGLRSFCCPSVLQDASEVSLRAAATPLTRRIPRARPITRKMLKFRREARPSTAGDIGPPGSPGNGGAAPGQDGGPGLQGQPRHRVGGGRI